MGICRDITAHRKAQEEIRQLNQDLELRVHDRTVRLQAANQELEAFAYSVSHDLRSPLRGIDGWSEALREDVGEIIGEKGVESGPDPVRSAAYGNPDRWTAGPLTADTIRNAIGAG
jgi:signal transduction histidine kinase